MSMWKCPKCGHEEMVWGLRNMDKCPKCKAERNKVTITYYTDF